MNTKPNRTSFVKGDPRLLGNKRALGNKPNATSFKKGERRSKATEFKPGAVPKATKEQIAKISAKNRGQKRPQMSGVNNPNWRGGVTGKSALIRESNEMRVWRETVFKRDDFTCQACGERGGKLHADHELPFSLFVELRFEVLNGRTLCVTCHRKTFGGIDYLRKTHMIYE